MPSNPPLAFVAMRFEKDAWNDRTYSAVRDVLKEAGYQVVRGDEVESSGAVVDEVLRLLSEADCVVIDTTGDSNNVAYELGYCHGIKRHHSSLILIRRRGARPAFNYSHYRHNVYNDLSHLRRMLRYRLRISTPLTLDQLGYALAMDVPNDAIGIYGADVADAVLKTLKTVNFSGRCEYYAVDHIGLDLYVVGLGLKPGNSKIKIDGRFWKQFTEIFRTELPLFNEKLTYLPNNSEYAEMRAFRQEFIASWRGRIRRWHADSASRRRRHRLKFRRLHTRTAWPLRRRLY